MSKGIEEKEKTEFTIEEAAEYCGKSVRTIERWKLPHTLQSRRGTDYIWREVRIYSKDILDEKLNPKETKVKPVAGLVRNEKIEKLDTNSVTRDDLKNFGEMLVTAFANQTKLLTPMADVDASKKPDLSNIAHKIFITKKEAVLLSGLTKQEISQGLDEKTIVGHKTSEKGVWKILRESLEDFCRNYGTNQNRNNGRSQRKAKANG